MGRSRRRSHLGRQDVRDIWNSGGGLFGRIRGLGGGLHPDDAEEARLETQRALDGAEAYDTQFRVVWPGWDPLDTGQGDGDPGRDGNPVSMMGLNWDITAEKEIEAKVGAAARDAQAALMETVEVAISELPIVLYSTGWVAGDGSERWLLGNAGSLLGVSKTDFEQGDDLLANVVSTDRGKIELEMAEARSKGRGSISPAVPRPWPGRNREMVSACRQTEPR